MKINVLGYGVMGRQIASLLFIGGYDVTVWSRSGIAVEDINRGIRLAKKQFSKYTEGSITVVPSLENFEDNLTIESVKEDLCIKRDMYAALKSRITKGYFSNTSSFSPNEIGDGVGGMHFFNPITIKLIEVYWPNSFAVSVEYNSMISYLSAQEFSIIEANANRGYLGNYILFSEISSAFRLIEKYGYSPEKIRNIYKNLYNGRDLFQIVDIIGIDVVFQILKNLSEVDHFIYVPQVFSSAINKNILGRKNKTSILDLAVLKGNDRGGTENV